MTGFGNAEGEQDGVTISIEIKTLNHRHLDSNIKVPTLYSTTEPEIRDLIAKYLKRGKVDVTFRREV